MSLNKKDKKSSFSLRDIKLARFLSRALDKKEEGKAEYIECPSSEDIAAFIDGHLSTKERDGILYHLNRCKHCYELFSETLETKREIEKEVIRDIASPLWKRAVPYAIAASLAFILIYALFRPWMRRHYYTDSGTYPLSFPLMAKKIDLLGEDIQGENSQFLFSRYPDTGYGFGGEGISLKNRLFIFGVYQTDLELSLIREDRERASATILAIDSLLNPVKQSDRIIQFYNDMQQRIEETTPLSNLLGTIDKPWFDDPSLIIYPRFGQWVEAGRIASLTMNNKVLKVEEADFFIDKLSDEDLPQGIMRSLQVIGAILEKGAKGALEEMDFKSIEGEFSNIMLIDF